MKVNFRDKLEHQFLYMEDSAAGYDRGARHEAIRLSTSLRVICHTTKKSTSLLTHLDAEGISFLSTSQQHVIGSGCVFNVADNFEVNIDTRKARAQPWLGAAPVTATVPFSSWWNSEVMFANSGVVVTRRSLVLWAANKDGGAHVDKNPDLDYQAVTRGLDLTLSVRNDTAGETSTMGVDECHLAALRQFAYEALNSPELLALAGRKRN